jgi:hypothetical protein
MIHVVLGGAEHHLGRVAAGRRRGGRELKPSITGMFQSSRTASGMARLHASSAFAPSSASMMLKPISSRIRRAIFRTTPDHRRQDRFSFFGSFRTMGSTPTGLSPRGLFGHDFQDAIDVEDDHELAVKAMDAAGELGHSS